MDDVCMYLYQNLMMNNKIVKIKIQIDDLDSIDILIR